MNEPPRLLQVKDAAQALGMATVTLRLWIAQRKIGAVRIGRSVRIPLTEVQKIVERGAVPALPEARRTMNAARKSITPSSTPVM